MREEEAKLRYQDLTLLLQVLANMKTRPNIRLDMENTFQNGLLCDLEKKVKKFPSQQKISLGYNYRIHRKTSKVKKLACKSDAKFLKMSLKWDTF